MFKHLHQSRFTLLSTSILAGAIGALLPAAPAQAAATPPSMTGEISVAPPSVASQSTTLNSAAGASAAVLAGSSDASIRPFSFRASDEDLAELKRRIVTAKWPE